MKIKNCDCYALNIDGSYMLFYFNFEPQQNYRLGTVSNELLWGGLTLVLRPQPHPQFLKWYKTFIWLFGSHDNPLTRQ